MDVTDFFNRFVEVFALQAEMQTMVAENQARIADGLSVAYPDFSGAAEDLRALKIKVDSPSASANSDYTAVLEQGIYDYAIIEHKQFDKESIRKLAAHLNSVLQNQNCA